MPTSMASAMATSLRSVGVSWTTVDRELEKLEIYTLIPELSMNFVFGFNDAQLDRKLVQAVSSLQETPRWISLP